MKIKKIKKLYMDALPYLTPLQNNKKKALIRWIEFNVEFMEKGFLKRKYSANSAYQKLVVIIRAAKKEKDDDIIREVMNIAEEVILKMLRDHYGHVVDFIQDNDFTAFATEHPEIFAQHILTENVRLAKGYQIRKEILDLVLKNPETEYPEALEMKRHYILHVGPTNCGKTFHSLQALKHSSNGIYLGPLRLLALEVFEKMNDEGVPCTMLTGEEQITVENSRVCACTVEMLDTTSEYDIAVIDEAQMIADETRGQSWTRAILGCRAKEIHVCMSPDALDMVKALINLTNDTYEEKFYERITELIFENQLYKFPKDVKPGDALIVFSKKDVLDIAGRLEKNGIKASVIYGSLPPAVRRRQVKMYEEGKTQVVVATDAIGMGINLPIRRIVFVRTMKYDGKEVRPLNTSEIKQIAGRAGRFGLYDKGFVATMNEESKRLVSTALDENLMPLDSVRLGFPQVLLNLNDSLDSILQTWYNDKPNHPFEKINIDELLFLYEKAYSRRKEIPDFEDKKTLYNMISCPIEIKNADIVSLWLYYCKTYNADPYLEKPFFERCSGESRLEVLETYYKSLGLYFQFARKMGKYIDEEWLVKEKIKTEDEIIELLMKNKKRYVKKCRYCGKTLEMGHQGSVCDSCYESSQFRYFAYNHGW